MKTGRNKQVILNFINALNTQDSNRVQSFFSETSQVRNPSGEMLVGQQAIWDAIAVVHDKAESIDLQIDQIHETECGSVETAGKLRFLVSDQWQEVELDGAFQVSGSKITQWQ